MVNRPISTGNLIAAIRQAAEGLAPVWPPPTEIDVRTCEAADAAVGGVLMSCFDSTARKHVGRRGIDWSDLGPLGGALCRMQFIGQLAAAYHVLHDERYAEAARDYMEDWMTFWTSDRAAGKVESDSSCPTASTRSATRCTTAA